MVTVKRKKKKTKKSPLTPQQKEQKQQIRDVRKCFDNMGFQRIPKIDGNHCEYEGRRSEFDDVFVYENIIIFTEYTTTNEPGDHLKGKLRIYELINQDTHKFIDFLYKDPKFKSLKNFFDEKVLNNYQLNHLQVKILYTSKHQLTLEHKNMAPDVNFFDYSVFKYFESTSRTIKKSTKYELFDFLKIENTSVGANIKKNDLTPEQGFYGHILPEEQSSFKKGYKLISFYMDAESLLKRSFVLRKDGWKNKDNIGLYQRMISNHKIKSMRKYLYTEDRVFINNIISTLPIDKVTLYDEEDKVIEIDDNGNIKAKNKTQARPVRIRIKDETNIIGIVDGQHRVYAYHEGTDTYEKKIAGLRTIQNLLVTGILYPANSKDEERLKFEAKLFLEINSNQQSASSKIKQAIEANLNLFSTTSIANFIINKLNESGPLGGMFEQYWFERNKLKTSSIISFGLKPLIKFDGKDSLYSIWKNKNKDELKKKENYDLLNEYKEFCVVQIRNIFISLKSNLEKENWTINHKEEKALLNVTFINGIINCLRLLIENNKLGSIEYYNKKLENIKDFNFKKYKTSNYRKMGEEIYNTYFSD